MKQHLLSFTIILIAFCAVSTRADAQNVYRCGSSYSQTPCPDGTRVDVQDSRTAEQKAQTDAATRRDAKTGDAMERARLREEADREKAQANAAVAKKKPTAKPAAHDQGNADGDTAPKPNATTHAKKKKTKEPDYFTARGTPPPPKSKKAASEPQ